MTFLASTLLASVVVVEAQTPVTIATIADGDMLVSRPSFGVLKRLQASLRLA